MYLKHLKKDKQLLPALKAQPVIVLEQASDIWLVLCVSIIGQQLSTKVAAIIKNRFVDLLPKNQQNPADVLLLDNVDLRGIGLSNAKVAYVKNVCTFFIENKITDEKLYQLNDEEIIQLLTQIKGVGQWTVEMILMFGLGRENVFSAGDLGIQKSMIQLYNIQFETKKELHQKMLTIAKQWHPYKTYACRYLWNFLDNK